MRKLAITTNWVNADMLLAWLQRRKKAGELVRRDATDLITCYGDAAYSVARMRSLDKKMIDVNRPQAHWSRVKMEIAKRHGIHIGLREADRREMNWPRDK